MKRRSRPLWQILLVCLCLSFLIFGLYFGAVDGLFHDMSNPTYLDPIAHSVPGRDAALEIREFSGFRFSGATFYLVPVQGEERYLGSVTTDEYLSFQNGQYRLNWLENGVSIHYQYASGGSVDDKEITFTLD